jgi:hypothetical protein
MLTFESFVMAISISRQVFSFLSSSNISGWFATLVRYVITGLSHVTVVPLSFMTLSGIIIISIIIIIIIINCYYVYVRYLHFYNWNKPGF